jgi:hypothetical protein
MALLHTDFAQAVTLSAQMRPARLCTVCVSVHAACVCAQEAVALRSWLRMHNAQSTLIHRWITKSIHRLSPVGLQASALSAN